MADKKLVYRTLTGTDVHYEPVNPITLELAETGLRKKMMKEGKLFEAPTYTVSVAGGGEQVFTHDEVSVKGDAEAEAKWAAYQEALLDFEAEVGKLRTNMILDCIMVELPLDDEWIHRQEANYIEVPTEAQELRYHYIKTELLKSAHDFRCLTLAIQQAGYLGIASEEVIDASSEIFRNFIPDLFREGTTSQIVTEDSISE